MLTNIVPQDFGMPLKVRAPSLSPGVPAPMRPPLPIQRVRRAETRAVFQMSFECNGLFSRYCFLTGPANNALIATDGLIGRGHRETVGLLALTLFAGLFS
ncbi:hypothetical protein BaRGS_00027797 [Batillaria attramentaria]|uniref:Uncharacterized protein n=1 Tax=Batillaria attramentaria TaxID=370345 RepID=A0ABD0K0V8_9CAEN